MRPLLAVPVLTALFALPASAQDQVQIRATHVRGAVHMITGQGGNIGLCVGEDGAIMIDDQYAPLTPRILETVAKVDARPVRFVINTHWHDDHTGGNENMGEAGAVLVAHENVRTRMSTDQVLEAIGRTVPAAPDAAKPVITFTDAVTFHWNDETVRVFHVEDAHTDGDAIVHFAEADVFHMGDTYFNGFYPFIDTSSHGNIDGMIAAAELVLEKVGEDTKIIPGHGPLSGVAELRAYRDMLVEARKNVAALVAEGKTRDEVIAAKPTRALDPEWGDGFLAPDVWVGIVFDGMVARRGTK